MYSAVTDVLSNTDVENLSLNQYLLFLVLIQKFLLYTYQSLRD
jgi:hypothetical protein